MGIALLLPALARAAAGDVSVVTLGEPSSAASEAAQDEAPLAPTPEQPQAPPAESAPPPRAPDDSGQWVYTQQYGWLWMPYGDAYASSPPGGYGDPYMYVFYPAVGWTWVVAPWIWGFGPRPFFGVHGFHRFAFFRHGWWRQPHAWRFAPRGHAFNRPAFGRGGGAFAPRGFRAAPGFVPRGGIGVRAAPGHAPLGARGAVGHVGGRVGGGFRGGGGGRHR
jgi:hypothetical protein